MTPEVTEALAQATDVIGYIPYVARVAPRDGLTLHPTDNRVELDRATHALQLAQAGARVVVVSSGDPGRASGVGPRASRGTPVGTDCFKDRCRQTDNSRHLNKT